MQARPDHFTLFLDMEQVYLRNWACVDRWHVVICIFKFGSLVCLLLFHVLLRVIQIMLGMGELRGCFRACQPLAFDVCVCVELVSSTTHVGDGRSAYGWYCCSFPVTRAERKLVVSRVRRMQTNLQSFVIASQGMPMLSSLWTALLFDMFGILAVLDCGHGDV